jgi:hypothetical protein
MSAVANITANIIAIQKPTSTIPSIATMSADASNVGIVTTSLVGASTSTANGLIVTPLSSNMSAVCTSSATAQINGAGVNVSVQGVSNVTISGTIEKSGVDIQTVGSLNANVSQISSVSGSFTATGSTTANVTKISNPTSSMQAISSLDGIQRWIQSISSNMQSISTSTANGNGIFNANSNISSTASISPYAIKNTYSSSSLQSVTVVVADGVAYDPRKLIIGQVYLKGSRDLNVDLKGSRDLNVGLKGLREMNVELKGGV